jgi:hypothetical protein
MLMMLSHLELDLSPQPLAGYGEYSWGKFVMASRAGLNSYTAYTQMELLELIHQ